MLGRERSDSESLFIHPTLRFDKIQVSIQQAFQAFFQLRSSAMDVGLHSSEWEVEDTCDLIVGASLDVSQDDARAILGSKTTDRFLDCRS